LIGRAISRKTTTMRGPEWQAWEQHLLIRLQQQQTHLRQGLLEPLFAFISGVGDDVIVLQKGAGPRGLDRSRCCLSPANGPAGAPLLAFLGDARITCSFVPRRGWMCWRKRFEILAGAYSPAHPSPRLNNPKVLCGRNDTIIQETPVTDAP
jgi:hypothetical protein